MWDSAMAENGILKCGRLTDFQTHQIEHQLGAYTDCNHGQGLAVIHPVYYRHIVKDARRNLPDLQRTYLARIPQKPVWRHWRASSKSAGCPQN